MDDDGQWAFAVRLYGKPEVADACLMLQDRYGIDVVVLLYCLFIASSRDTVLSEQLILAAKDHVQEWRETVVSPLRAVRQGLKSSAAENPAVARLRSTVKAAELEAERLQFGLLAAWHRKSQGSGPAPTQIRAEDWTELIVTSMAADDLGEDARQAIRTIAWGMSALA